MAQYRDKELFSVSMRVDIRKVNRRYGASYPDDPTDYYDQTTGESINISDNVSFKEAYTLVDALDAIRRIHDAITVDDENG